jgi:aminotransferase
MLRVAEREDLIVIADEVYKDFLYGEARIHSAATEVWARHRVLRVCSFSKAYAMTGWRVGFVHGPAPLISEVLKVHDTLVTCAPVVSQYAALAALESGDGEIAGFRTEFKRRSAQDIDRLDALPHVFVQKPKMRLLRVSAGEGHDSTGARLAPARRQHPRPGARGPSSESPSGPTGESHLRLSATLARPLTSTGRSTVSTRLLRRSTGAR